MNSPASTTNRRENPIRKKTPKLIESKSDKRDISSCSPLGFCDSKYLRKL